VAEANEREYAARFSMLLTIRGGGTPSELFADRVDVKDANRWRRQTLSLDDFALEWVELCIATEALGSAHTEATEAFAFWSNPRITLGGQKYPTAGQKDIDDDLTEEEIEARRAHLRALGYVE
jgi:hypothetical protein